MSNALKEDLNLVVSLDVGVPDINEDSNASKWTLRDSRQVIKLEGAQSPPFKESELITITVDQDFRDFDSFKELDKVNPLAHEVHN